MPVSIPPFTDVPAPGDPLASPWAQHITQHVVDDITIGAVAPTNPEAELWYDTSDPGVSYPNMPRGWVAESKPTVDQAGIATTTWTDVTNMSVTFTADPTRRYKTTVVLVSYPSVAATVSVRLTNAAGSSAIKAQYVSVPSVNGYAAHSFVHVESGLSGSNTRKAQAYVSAGTLTIYGSLPSCLLLVEDIGGV